MKREIEFRAKEKHEPSRWQYGYYIKHKLTNPCPVIFSGETEEDKIPKYEEYLIIEQDGDWDMESTQYKVTINPTTLGQYTGFHDKNGIKIYEGDIVKAKFYNKDVLGRVDYCYGCPTLVDSCVSDNQLWMFYDIEVIGNIWENGDLLNGNIKKGED